MTDYKTGTRWRRLRPHQAFAKARCVLCDAETDLCADCDFPAVEAAEDHGAMTASEGWFVPLCQQCWDKMATTNAPADQSKAEPR